MSEEQMTDDEIASLVSNLKHSQTVYGWINRQNQEAAKAIEQLQATLSAKSVPPIERDEEMQRDYIPLPANWEIQTKGKGSTFRLAKTDGSDIRWPILEEMIHEPLEQMAREIHAAWQAAPQVPTDDDRVRELEKAVWVLKQIANLDPKNSGLIGTAVFMAKEAIASMTGEQK